MMANSARNRGKLKRVVARHGRTCHLCGKNISPMFKNPHPDALTIDHVTPISKGGAVWDVENMRPAHKSCNEAKGNGEPQAAKKKQTVEVLTHRPFGRLGS